MRGELQQESQASGHGGIRDNSVAACRVPRSDRSPVAAGSREVKGLTPCKVAVSGSALGGYSRYARSKPGRPVSPCCEVFVVMELSGPVNIVDEV